MIILLPDQIQPHVYFNSKIYSIKEFYGLVQSGKVILNDEDEEFYTQEHYNKNKEKLDIVYNQQDIFLAIMEKSRNLIDDAYYGKISDLEIKKFLDTESGLEYFAHHYIATDSRTLKKNEKIIDCYITFLKSIVKKYKNSNIPEGFAINLKIIINMHEYGKKLKQLNNESKVITKKCNEITNLEKTILKYIDNHIRKNNKVLNKSIEQKFKSLKLNSNKKNYLSYFNQVDKKDLWRFYVDGKYQKRRKENGWYAWESRELGSLNNLNSAFIYAMQNSETKLNVELITKIHSIAIQSGTSIDKKPVIRTKNDVSVHYNMPMYTLLGMDELMKEKVNNHRSYQTGAYYHTKDEDMHYDKKSKKYRTIRVLYTAFDTKKLKIEINKIITEYYKNINKFKDNRILTLKAIVKLCASLIRLHPFTDGNGRVLVNVILNRELLLNNFKPTILEDPNLFDNMSINESCMETLKGMETFEYICKNGFYPSKGILFKIGSFSTITKSTTFDDNYKKNPKKFTSAKFQANIARLNKINNTKVNKNPEEIFTKKLNLISLNQLKDKKRLSIK